MDCKDCTRYSSEHGKCLDGKVNPHRWEIAVSVANVYGLRSICVFNDYRERLVNCRGNKLPKDPGASAPSRPDAQRRLE